MNNLLKIFIGLIILLMPTFLPAQVVEQYEEGTNYIKIVLHLDGVVLNNAAGSYQGYFDESNPGNFSLPLRTIFVAMPGNNPFSLNCSILKSKQFNFELGLNPQVQKRSDSTLAYNFNPDFDYQQSYPELVQFAGCRSIDKINCAEFLIKQFSYNIASKQITQIEKIELIIRFQNPLHISASKTIQFAENSTASIIINSVQTKIEGLISDLPLTNKKSDWIDDNLQYVKVGTNADGIYRIYGYQLENLGIKINFINPSTIKIFLRGDPVPIFVKTNRPDIFAKNDFIEFIGKRNLGGAHREISSFDESYKEYLDRYSDTTIYWVTWNISNPVLVSEVSSVSSQSKDTLSYYYEINHFEQNNWFDFSAANLVRREFPYWIENKTWGWSGLSVGTRNNSFTTTNIFPGKPIRLYAKLQSYATSIPSKSHHLAISLNSSPVIDSAYINQFDQVVLSGEFQPNFLLTGNNIFKVHSFPTSSLINLCFFDWYEVEYPRYLIPIEGKLFAKFSSLQNKKEYLVKIGNVSNVPFSLWINGEKSKKFTVPVWNNQIIIADTLGKQSELFYSEETKIPSPIFYYSKKFDRLANNNNKAEYILITHKKFLAKAKDYAKFIGDNYELITKVVDVEDIYDEFSFGFFNPETIREFLKYAFYNWKQAKLKYVCLVGGATYDYHGNKATYQGAPRFYNYVPSFGSPVSDTWFVIFDSSKTVIPDISIGRIPVTTNQEFDWYFQKHKEYIQQPFNAWNKRVMFFSGGTGNDQSQIDALRKVNEFIIQNYVNPKPISAKYTHFYKTINPVNNFGPYSSKQISSAIDSSGVFISYLGHSGTQTWDNSITDPKQLQNKVNRYPLITDFGCSTARFAEPDVISFSQAFVNYGQAIAYIANSSLGFTSTSYSFPQIFYKKLLRDSVNTIGDAHRLAKLELISKFGSSGAYQLFVLTNTLIGDPVIKLRIPTKPNLSITEKGITILDENYSDSIDSLNIKLNIYNFGLAVSQSYKIIMQAFHKSMLHYSKEFTRNIPDYSDSLILKLLVKGLNGEHQITVTLDPDQSINEIYENDNSVSFQFIVPSGSVKFLVNSNVENYLKNPLRILSPTIKNHSESVTLEAAADKSFHNSKIYRVILDTVITSFNIENIFADKRIWLRSKSNSTDTTGSAISFKLSTKNSFALFDSLSFSKQYSANLKFKNSFYLDSTYIRFNLLSAGLNDGNTALILKDGQNHIPENTLRGHHVAIFKGKNYQFAGYRLFDVFGGGTSVANDYIKFLDTLSSDYLVAFTLSDEGTVSSSVLRNKIKEFGSKYIDNVSFRSSWVMLGRKGSRTGTVPEKFAKQYQGRVETDTVILSNYRTGELKTNVIGPAGRWKQLNTGLTGSTDFFSLSVLGSSGLSYDTLLTTNERKVTYDLSSIDPAKYPYLKVNLELSSENINDAVTIDSLIVDYLKPPELVISNKTASVSNDTLKQGEVITLNYFIYNTGETTAKNVNTALQLFRADGFKILENLISVDSIKPDSRKNYSFNYDTRNLSGSFYFVINVDPDRSMNEIYSDNNYLSVPFYVKGDESIPIVQIKFDEIDIFDGDYISPNPNIRISISNSSVIPIYDTTSVEIYLNNRRLYFSNNSMLNYSFSNSNPKMIIDYKPVLDDGEYLLKVNAKNPNNSLIDITTVQKRFLVSKDTKLLYVYNYPNPFSEKTFFTFKLTQTPDELKIRIYTLAGRLVREIVKHEGELNYDFNIIEWDGKDEDGSSIANGIYLYKVIIKKGNEVVTATQKLAVIR
jgi:hypothetical protein